jgi:quinol monooxygenase YgiN
MIVVTGSFRLPVENVAQARPAMERVISASREEPGCLAYSYSEDVLEPGLFIVSEMWVNGDLLANHFQMPHMKAWQEEREAFGMTDRAVTMHAVKHSTDL